MLLRAYMVFVVYAFLVFLQRYFHLSASLGRGVQVLQVFWPGPHVPHDDGGDHNAEHLVLTLLNVLNTALWAAPFNGLVARETRVYVVTYLGGGTHDPTSPCMPLV